VCDDAAAVAAAASAAPLDAWAVAQYTVAMALASGLGALPFFIVSSDKMDRQFVGGANAIASGVTLAASFGMIYEGVYSEDFDGQYHLVVFGMLIGYMFIAVCESMLDDKDCALGDLSGAGARRAVLILLIMTMHSFAEGLGVGVSWAGEKGEQQGKFVSAAIAVHNIPEGMTVALLMVPVTKSAWAGVFWAIFSNLPQPILAVPAYMFVDAFRRLLPIGTGAAAGAMIFMVFAELIPDALDDLSPSATGHIVTVSVALMVGLQLILQASVS
jgi:ZIP family zinc transporter